MPGILGAWGPPGDLPGVAARGAHAMAHRGAPARVPEGDAAVLLAVGPGARPGEHAATRGAWSVVTAGRALRGERGTAEALAEAAAETGILRAMGLVEGEVAALAIDRDRAERWIVRDHAGTRPLWIGKRGPVLVAATDLLALVRAGVAPAQVSLDDVRRYVTLGIVPPPGRGSPACARSLPGPQSDWPPTAARSRSAGPGPRLARRGPGRRATVARRPALGD